MQNTFHHPCEKRENISSFWYVCRTDRGSVSHYHGKALRFRTGSSHREACYHRHANDSAAYKCTNRQEYALSTRKLVILAVFSHDYHDGMWSHVYRVGCRARTILSDRLGWRTLTDGQYRDARRTNLYRELVSKFGK